MSLGETSYGVDVSGNFDAPGYLTLGQSAFSWISGVGGAAGDQDVFETYLQAGVSYTIDVTGLDIGGGELPNAYLEIYNGNGLFEGFLEPDANGDIAWNFTVATSGFYYFNVSGFGVSDIGGYGITLYTSPDDHGGNLVGGGILPAGTPLELGVTLSGTLELPADGDTFILNANAGTRYFWSVSTDIPDLFATVDNASYQRQTFDVLPAQASGEFVAIDGGPYMISFSSNLWTSTGSYEVFVQAAISPDKAIYAGTVVGDSLTGSGADDELWGWDGNDTVDAAGGNDFLLGNRGNDVLNGGDGIDTAFFGGPRSEYNVSALSGGLLLIADNLPQGDGQDTVGSIEFFQFADGVFSLAQMLENEPPGPPDPPGDPDPPVVPPVTLYTTASLTLPDGVLNLVATGSAHVKLTGNVLNNSITGNAGKNIINALAGNDKLNGKLGLDTLLGGKGKDGFVFNTKLSKSNIDKVKDFSVKDDTVYLDNAIFKKLGKGTEFKPGKLNKKLFAIGDEAKDVNDYLIYNKKTGALYYDADGSGKGAALHFATLSKNLKMTVADFLLI